FSAILIFEKFALCHRPTPLTTNLCEALSSRTGQKNQNWRMSTAIHRDPDAAHPIYNIVPVSFGPSVRFRTALVLTPL
ncbi:hypothetical protein N7379_25165, partial [Rhizobium pusense]|nr:hypothetical protein [Agrobacterium pusense]